MGRFREQVATTRADVEARRGRGESVRDPYEGITEEMLQSVSQQYTQATQAIKQDIKDLYASSPPGGPPPDPRWVQRQINTINQRHTTAFNASISEQFGNQGELILQGVSGHTQRPGVIDKYLSKLATPGGFLGAAGLGIAAFLGMGGMGGGILAIGAGLLAGVAGGALGGSVNEWITGRNGSQVQPAPPIPDINAPGQNPAPQPGQNMVPGDLTPGASPPPPPTQAAPARGVS
jgi:hypothetical protein